MSEIPASSFHEVAETTEVPHRFDARQVATLGAAMLGFFVVALDAQIVNVALPDIGASGDRSHLDGRVLRRGFRPEPLPMTSATHTPLATGLLFLPMTAFVNVLSSCAAALVERFGRRTLITTGLLLQCAGWSSSPHPASLTLAPDRRN